MLKNILIAIFAVLLLVALVMYKLYIDLDSIVAGVIEDVGSDVLKTDVRVTNVSIDLRAGRAVISGMTIANPEGYSSAKVFELNHVAVDLDLKSLGEDVLVIEMVSVGNPRINFEGDAEGGSNVQTLMDNIKSGSSAKSTSADSGAKSGTEETKMIINSFKLTGAEVRAETELKPGEPVDIELPTIKMSGIGKAQGGVTADVVAKEIASEMIGATLKAVAKAGIKKTIEKEKQGFLDRLKGKD